MSLSSLPSQPRLRLGVPHGTGRPDRSLANLPLKLLQPSPTYATFGSIQPSWPPPLKLKNAYTSAKTDAVSQTSGLRRIAARIASSGRQPSCASVIATRPFRARNREQSKYTGVLQIFSILHVPQLCERLGRQRRRDGRVSAVLEGGSRLIGRSSSAAN